MANFTWPINPTSVNPGPVEFVKNGVVTSVSADTVTPSNSTPLPVQVYGLSGPINVTAGDLNVQISHTGANYDSTRIGDGTTLLGITGSNEAKVSDATAQSTLSSINTKLPSNLTVSSTRLLTDSSGVTQPISAASLPLPTGAATETTLSAINTKFPAQVGGKIPVETSGGTVKALQSHVQRFATASATGAVFANDGDMVAELVVGLRNTFVASVIAELSADNVQWTQVPFYPLDGGTPVMTISSIGNWKVINTGRYYRISVSSYTSGTVWITAQEKGLPVASHVTAYQGGTWNVNNISGTVSLPTGAATSALQTTANTSLASIDTKLTSPLSVSQNGTWTVQPGNTANTTPWLVAQAGRTAVGKARNDYSSVNVTTGAYTQLVASTASAVKEVEIFDSSGQTLVLATGAAASEVDQVYILPGGNGRIPLAIASGTRISVKAVSANATSGEITINLYG